MKSKDVDLIAEAYLSALQKIHNTPTDPATEDIAEVNPEVTDIENTEHQPVMVAATPEGPSIQPNVEDENEELWMVRSNLFSLYTNAKKIHNLIQMGLDLEPWMQEKIAVATDGLEGVMKSVAYHAAEKGVQG